MAVHKLILKTDTTMQLYRGKNYTTVIIEFDELKDYNDQIFVQYLKFGIPYVIDKHLLVHKILVSFFKRMIFLLYELATAIYSFVCLFISRKYKHKVDKTW